LDIDILILVVVQGLIGVQLQNIHL